MTEVDPKEPVQPHEASDLAACAPLFRWAGGKRWLAPRLRELVDPSKYHAYYEPFLGGGAIFFGLWTALDAKLSDANPALIRAYEVIRDDPEAVFETYSGWPNSSDVYYELRARISSDDIEHAAKFVYLNHHSYNGIHRVNLKGQYNVPFGARMSPKMPTFEHLELASRRLAAATLRNADFEDAMQGVVSGDLVFLDPPYIIAGDNEAFVKYTRDVFSYEDQMRLSNAIARIVEVGASFILTNAAHASISKLFREYGKMYRISRRNSIGGKLASRGQADEYVFTNLRVKGGAL